MSMAPDQAVRNQALDISQSFIVQAPAGSGKTELLIQRYLNLLAHVDEPEEVLAITFTRKAVAEMRHRVLSALQSCEDAEPESAHERLTWQLANKAMLHAQEKQWNLQAQPARLRIMTIDSLNASLVKRMPWLSGAGADVVLEQQPQQLYEEAAWQTLNSNNAGSETRQALQNLLLHLDNNDRRVVRLLVSLLARRDQWLRYLVPLKVEEETRQQLTQMFEHVIEEQLQRITAQIPADIGHEMIRLAAIGAGRLHEAGETAKSQIHLRGLDTLPAANFQSLSQWKALADLYLTTANGWRKVFNKNQGFPPKCDEKDALNALFFRLQAYAESQPELRQGLIDIRSMPQQIYGDAQWQLLEALIELLPVAVGHLKLVFQSHSAMDFVEQSLAASMALGEGDNVTDLALKLDYQLSHILMDEFQDTSHSQFRLLEKLIGGWQPDDGHSLFLVGDPMQSIYLFREADVSGFLRVRDHGIGPIRPQSLILEANFRSTPALMQWFNAVFPDVLSKRDDLSLGAVRYTPAVAARGHSHGHGDLAGSAVTVHAGLDRDAVTEAELMLEQIQQASEADPEQSIGVLVRSRSQLHELFPLLQANAIDFQAVEILPLASQPVIQDLLSVTRSLLHRHDRIAWLAVLRAPWCGLTLESLHMLVNSGQADDSRADLWSLMNDEAIQDQLDAGERQRLQRLIRCYEPILNASEQLSFRTRVEWLWQSLGGPDCHAPANINTNIDCNAGINSGDQAQQDAARYLDLLDELDQAGQSSGQAITLNSIQARLRDGYSSGASYSGARVQLMTIHKSKGLQFDTVILPALERGSRADDKALMVWHEELGADYTSRLLLAPIHAPGSNDQSYDYVRGREQRRRAYETQRLLYVAITRARNQLHLFAALKSDKDGDPGRPAKDSFLALLESHLREDFLELAPISADEDSNNEVAEAGLALKRVPPGWQPKRHGSNVEWQPSDELQLEQERIEQKSIEYSWAGQAARLVGTVTHQYLHQLGEQGLDGWSTGDIEQQRPAIAASLTSTGLPPTALDESTDKVIEALGNVISDERAQWILTNHKDAQSEYAISGVINGKIVSRIIDRTFIDADGTRWIIDYKTSTHEGGNPQGFLDEEQKRYEAQLNEYAQMLGTMGTESVKLGLYFPLMKGWREWG